MFHSPLNIDYCDYVELLKIYFCLGWFRTGKNFHDNSNSAAAALSLEGTAWLLLLAALVFQGLLLTASWKSLLMGLGFAGFALGCRSSSIPQGGFSGLLGACWGCPSEVLPQVSGA